MQLTGADHRIRLHTSNQVDWDKIDRLGIAVSGGGDSLALLHILSHCAGEYGVAVEAATVDHGLRPEAQAEAAFVAETCAGLGVPHEVLRWQGWDGKGNLQAEARRARYRLLAAWAARRGLSCVALGHTMDDQAETFLMRLKRASGVDGLSAMETEFLRNGASFCRPMLALERDELRAFLTRHGFEWLDDPSNDDVRFDRVRMRNLLPVLEEAGIGKTTLQEVALNMASASAALKRQTQDAALEIAQVQHGQVVFDRKSLLACTPEIRRRLIVAALRWVSLSDYPARREALEDLDRAIAARKTHTLHGCIILTDGKELRFARENKAVDGAFGPADAVWDDRWRLTGPYLPGMEIRALGAAITQCPWRDSGLPRATLLATPAVWQGEVLIAAPLAGLANGWSAEIDHPWGDFHTSVLTH